MPISKADKGRLDVLAAKKCKEHAGHQCVRCFKRSPNPEDVDEGLQWAHIVTRGALTTRWNLKNCLCLCAGCHFWGHKHPIDFSMWLIKEFGEEWYYQLKRSPKKKLFYDSVKEALENSTVEDCLIPKEVKETL